MSQLLLYNFLALNLGFILDLVFGDPSYSWHPIIILGNLNRKIEKTIYQDKRRSGALHVLLSVFITGVVTFALLYGAYIIHHILYLVLSTIMAYQIYATKSLKQASELVYHHLEKKDIEKARIAVSMIVGRNTEQLNEEEIINACIESVVENTSDGITAPMFFMALGSPGLAMIYKDINTMDSMIAYKNIQYSNYGYVAAKLDDLVNLIPARLTAYFMMISSFILNYDYRKSLNIYLRDRKNHLSPNAGHLEAASAGALNIQLGGTHTYFNKVVEKPTIGDKIKNSSREDIVKANNLMLYSSVISLLFYDIIYMLLLR